MTVKEMIQAYYPGVWTKVQVDDLLKNNKISVVDYLSLFPITEDNPVTDEMIALFRESKLVELRAVCNKMIEQGVDVTTSNSGKETEHFSLDSYSQNRCV